MNRRRRLQIVDEHLPTLFRLFLLAEVVAFMILFARLDMHRLLVGVADGSGYYLQIGRNAAHGYGFSFDGTHATNGFHPLWQVTLVALFKLWTGGSAGAYRATAMIVCILTGAASLLFHRALRQMVSPRAAVAGSAVYAALAFANMNLMESALVLVTTSGLLLYGCKARVFATFNPRAALTFGLILGTCLLARLDFGIFALVLGVWLLIDVARAKDNRGPRLIRLCCISGGAALLVVPLLGYNQVVFGAIVPISGRLELRPSPATLSQALQSFRDLGKLRQIPLVAGAVYLAWLVGRRRSAMTGMVRTDNDPRDERLRYLESATGVLAAAAIVHVANELVEMKWTLYWHFVALVPLAGLVVARLAQAALQGDRPWRGRITVCLVLAVVAGVGAKSVRRLTHAPVTEDWRSAAYDTALWLRAETAPTVRIAMLAPEITGYFSERSVLDLNGLAGGPDLQEALRAHRLKDYLADNQVRYLAQTSFLESIETMGQPDATLVGGRYTTARLRVDAGLWPGISELVTLRRRDEVFRSPGCAAGITSCGIVWRLDSSDGPPARTP